MKLMRWSVTPVVGKVVGADALAAVAGADFGLSLVRSLLMLFLAFRLVEPGFQHAQGLGEVLVLALFVLARDDDVRFVVRQADGRGGLVDVLPAGTAGVENVLAIVVGLQVDLNVFRLGHHRHGGGGGVDAALGLGFGHALDAMSAALELELADRPLRLRRPGSPP